MRLKIGCKNEKMLEFRSGLKPARLWTKCKIRAKMLNGQVEKAAAQKRGYWMNPVGTQKG
jgi:hypothetical protein